MECFKVLGQPLSVYSDDEGALNSKKLQTFFKEEGITHVVTKTHANQAERMIRTIKKMIGDRLRHYKTKTWVEVLKPSLHRYNDQVHSSTKTTPNNAHKGNYVSRKETRSQWSERKHKVILVGRDLMNNRYYKLDGMSKRYNRHEFLLVD